MNQKAIGVPKHRKEKTENIIFRVNGLVAPAVALEAWPSSKMLGRGYGKFQVQIPTGRAKKCYLCRTCSST